jgi:DNA-binding MarR family transcriptional regulator
MNDMGINQDASDVPMTTLLRFARKTYTRAVTEALKHADCGDVPKNGAYVIAGIARTNTRLEDLLKQLGISKQAASQLIDALAVRGYINRDPDPDDRRRLMVGLTERGMLAADTIRAAISSIDKELVNEIGIENVNTAKNTLAVIIDINDRHHGLPRGPR